MNLGAVDDTVRVRRDMRNEAGGIMVAPLAIASPRVARRTWLRCPIRSSLSVQILDPAVDVTTIAVVGSGNIHQGRTMAYGRCLIVDAEDPDRVIALIDGQGAVIGTPPDGLEKTDVAGTELVIEDSPDLPPLWQAFGAAQRDDGHWALPELRPELASPDAALHIGPQHVLLETAAVDLAAERAGTRKLQVQSWHVMFMARGKVGPFRAAGTAHRGPCGRVAVRMLICDEGNHNRPIIRLSGIDALP